ncbi:MAG: ion transporter [Acidobacteriota bacterium]
MGQRLVDILISERLVMAVILINTAAMTAAGFFAEGSEQRIFLNRVDYACVLFFLLEVVLKVRRLGWRRYRASGWNRFDLIITVLCLPVLVEPFAHQEHYPIWLPVFRAGRLFRLFRLLRFIPDAANLAAGIGRSLKASVGVFLGLALVNLLFSLSAHAIFGEVFPEKFGDPARSLYSMFQIFTLEGWNEYPDKIGERGGEGWEMGARLFFAVAVLIGGVLGLSLANAVFIDEMTLDNTKQLENQVESLAHEVRRLSQLLEKSAKTEASSGSEESKTSEMLE